MSDADVSVAAGAPCSRMFATIGRDPVFAVSASFRPVYARLFRSGDSGLRNDGVAHYSLFFTGTSVCFRTQVMLWMQDEPPIAHLLETFLHFDCYEVEQFFLHLFIPPFFCK